MAGLTVSAHAEAAQVPVGPGKLLAFPAVTPNFPVAGFKPQVAYTLTDRWSSNDQVWSPISQAAPSGNTLTDSAGNTINFATFDSGSPVHILPGSLYTQAILSNANRYNPNIQPIGGVGGSNSVDGQITDPIGVYVSGVHNATPSGSTATVTSSTWRGQYNSAVVMVPQGQTLPAVVGTPLLWQYSMSISNTQTIRKTIGGQVIRTPSVSLQGAGAAPQHQFKAIVEMVDANGTAASGATFIPSISNFNNWIDDPSSPTIWSYPFLRTNVTHTGGTISNEQFLFDTGAQATVISEAIANAIGIDVASPTPDFTVDVAGFGGDKTVAPGFIVNSLSLPVSGNGGAPLTFTNVPVVVLNITDPRDGDGPIPGILGMNLFGDRDISVDLLNTSDRYVRFSAPVTPQWNVNSNGTWTTDANWALGVPDGAELPANFLGAITAARTINVNGAVTVGSIKFDNANSYTLAGSGRITMETVVGPANIKVVSGSHTIAAPMTLAASTAIDVATGSTLSMTGDNATLTANVSKSGAGTLRLARARFKSLAVTAGPVVINTTASPTSNASRLESLTIATGASLDLTNNPLAIDYTGASPITTLRGDLLATRLRSSTLASNQALGFGEANKVFTTVPATWLGVAIDSTTLLVCPTLKGDANLDLTVNFDDLLLVAAGYRLNNLNWTGGDFNYDGVTNFDDLLALASNYNQTFTGTLAGDWALAGSIVPEPASLSAIAFGAGAMLRRKRRTQSVSLG